MLDRVAKSYEDTYRQTALIDDEQMLAPLSANPLREPREHFLRRAGDHYEARTLRLNRIAKDAGFTVDSRTPAPELKKHMRWLVQFQMRCQSYADIARAEGLRFISDFPTNLSATFLHLFGQRLVLDVEQVLLGSLPGNLDARGAHQRSEVIHAVHG